jgi:hypothetical protein
MMRTCLAAVAGLLPLFAARGDALPEDPRFAWRQPLLATFASGQVYRVQLPAGVLDRSRAFPADVRIVDEHGATWPFFLWAPSRRAGIEIVTARVTRKQGGVGNEEPLELDLLVGRGDGRSPHNQVILRTTGQDFVRRVEVLAEQEGAGWTEVGRGYILDQVQEAHLQSRAVSYTETRAPRLRVRIHPNAREIDEAFSLVDAQVAHSSAPAAPPAVVPLVPVTLPASELRDGLLTLAFDTGARHQPLDTLRIAVQGQGFTFQVKVFGRNEASQPWRWIADGGIYRNSAQERDSVDLRGASYRLLKVEVHHYDQRAPLVAGVMAEMSPQYLVFEAGAGVRPMLTYGADGVPMPRYDLPRRVKPEMIAAAPLVELGQPRYNPRKLATGLRSYSEAFMWLAIGLGIALAAMAALRLWRNRLT